MMSPKESLCRQLGKVFRRSDSMELLTVIALIGSGTLWGNSNDVWDNKPLGKPVNAQFGTPPIKHKLQSNRVDLPAKGKNIKLVVDKRPMAVIWYSTKDRAGAAAARLLRSELAQSSGMALHLINERRQDAKIRVDKTRFQVEVKGKSFSYIIFVGENPYAQKLGITKAQLPAEGFWLKSRGNALFIVGNDSGPTYGVIELLERWGFRKLWPGKLGSVDPQLTTYEISPIDFRDYPALHQRGMRCPVTLGKKNCRVPRRQLNGLKKLHFPTELVNYQMPEKIVWAAWQRLGGTLKIQAHHSYGDFWARFGQSHPEFFALLKNGSRHPLPYAKPFRAQLCFSNPELLEVIAQDRIAKLKAGKTLVSISPEDGGGGNAPCLCIRCRLLDPANGDKITLPTRDSYVSISDRYIHCFNQVAEKIIRAVPGAKVALIAYSQYRSAPLAVHAHSNLIVGYVGYDYTNAPYLQDCRQEWDKWTQRANQLYWRPNLFYGQRELLACYATDLGRDIPHLYQTGMVGTDIDTFANSWATNGLNYYVVSRLLWNPAQDVEQIIADYCQTGFGAAAPHIRQYIAAVEKITRRNAAQAEDFRQKAMADADNDQPGYKLPGANFLAGYTATDFKVLYRILAAADAVNCDPVIRQRIDFLRAGVKFTELRQKVFNICYHHPGTPMEISRILNEQYEYFKTLLIGYPHAVDVGMVSFYDHNFWSDLNWQAPAAKRLTNSAELKKIQRAYSANLPSQLK